MNKLSRRRFLLRLVPATLSAMLPATTLAQGYYGDELPPPPMTNQEYGQEIKDVKLAMSMLRTDRNMDRADLDKVMECVPGCYWVGPEKVRV